MLELIKKLESTQILEKSAQSTIVGGIDWSRCVCPSVYCCPIK
ncbi:hypothetical protein IMCC3317_19930 [Kordia antarctica]|uniref:Uncharacterized protein n=1 Tax=Kordia antarctica TaxID=1218801 RepID=A0A7L4ZJB4_9FLAO|nr:hypothetical protein IMCC3317_19930 [Kordia antarctica]